jgi:hypothetical protein
VSNILLDRATVDRGYFKKSVVEKLVHDNSNSGEYATEIFSLVVLELWHREFLGNGNGHAMPVSSTSSIPENVLAPPLNVRL